MFDILQIVFWSVTYILIIIASFQSRYIKKVSMPYIAGVLNFSWEFCALIGSCGFWGHILWFGLDCIIVWFGFCYSRSLKTRLLYFISISVMSFVLFFTFQIRNGQLISSFVIDLIMAICFVVKAKELSPKLKISIASTKLLGDVFAGIHYSNESFIVAVITVIVFVCNLFYLCYCLEENHRKSLKTNVNKKNKHNKRKTT